MKFHLFQPKHAKVGRDSNLVPTILCQPLKQGSNQLLNMFNTIRAETF